MPVYEPDPPPRVDPLIGQRGQDIQMPHIDLDPSPVMPGIHGCPGIMLAGTNACVLPQ
jgi:hypothetical protein